MPIGSYTVVPQVAHMLLQERPQRILDLGIGFGFFGCMVRQWLDYGVSPWSTYLVGVEAWGAYGNPAWELYNLVVVDTIQNYLQGNQEQFDWVMMGDVIEHFDKQEGARVLEAVKRLLPPGGTLLVATPAVFAEQGAVHGNELEQHRSFWTPEDFTQLGFSLVMDGQPDQFRSQMLLARWGG